MYPHPFSTLHRFPYPVGQFRLFSAVAMGFMASIGFFWATTHYEWFILPRQIYLLFGISAGVFLGIYETRLVLAKLSKNKEAFVWQVWVIGAILLWLPLLLATGFFGTSEYLPFIFYVFPMVPVYLGVSGWYFSKFEQENRVSVFMFYFGFKYWKQINPVISERFQFFLNDVASKDPSQFLGPAGSSLTYVGYAKKFIEELERCQEIDPLTRNNLLKILNAMNTYRLIGLCFLSAFLLSVTCFGIFAVYGGFGLTLFGLKFADMVGIMAWIIFVTFVISFFIFIKFLQKRIARLLSNTEI
jgi:hypothetical protein